MQHHVDHRGEGKASKLLDQLCFEELRMGIVDTQSQKAGSWREDGKAEGHFVQFPDKDV